MAAHGGAWRRGGCKIGGMAGPKKSYSGAELLRDAKPPTDDDVSLTTDGRRLDTAEAVVHFFDELRAERAAESASA